MSSETKVAIITGAAGGSAGHCARSSWPMVIGSRRLTLPEPASRTSRLLSEKSMLASPSNLGSEAEIVASVGKIAEHFGRIDVLVNNAAIGPTMAATADTSIEGFRQALAVNLVGPLVLARESRGPHGPARWRDTSTRRRLPVSSPTPKRNAYAASKAGVVSMTKSLACELASRNIRVVAIAPAMCARRWSPGLSATVKADLSRCASAFPWAAWPGRTRWQRSSASSPPTKRATSPERLLPSMEVGLLQPAGRGTSAGGWHTGGRAFRTRPEERHPQSSR